MEATATQAPTCAKCGRTLRAAKSIARNLGPLCWLRVRLAAAAQLAAGVKAGQVAKAVEVITDGGVRLIRGGVYRVVSTTGLAGYLTHAKGNCNCPAGLVRIPRACYHALAVRIITWSAA